MTIWNPNKQADRNNAVRLLSVFQRMVQSSGLTMAMCSSSSCFCMIPMRRGRMGAPD